MKVMPARRVYIVATHKYEVVYFKKAWKTLAAKPLAQKI
jgi:hypothetical protein